MSVFAKLNLKDQPEILVLNPPASFEPALAELSAVRALRDAAQVAQIRFALAFVTSRAQIAELAPVLTDRAADDALLWFAYPKKSSKRYRCDFSRDSGWEPRAPISHTAPAAAADLQAVARRTPVCRLDVESLRQRRQTVRAPHHDSISTPSLRTGMRNEG